jgi:hypothetical protein
MKHDKTFEAIAKLQDIEIELRRLKTALVMANKALDAAVIVERNACAKVVERYTGAWSDEGYALANAIRARGEQ